MKFNTLETSHPTDVAQNRRRAALLAALFAAVSALAAADLFSDIGEGASARHWAMEGMILVAGLVGLIAMARAVLRLSTTAKRLAGEKRALRSQLRVTADRAQALDEELSRTAEEATRWRAEARELVEGLAAAIDRQFEAWGLTDAEREVALLLLKGLSHKEIADVRDTSDTTARQQARAVYKKAGLCGRNDLSAFFLEDLLLPSQLTTHAG